MEDRERHIVLIQRRRVCFGVAMTLVGALLCAYVALAEGLILVCLGSPATVSFVADAVIYRRRRGSGQAR